MSRSVLQHLLSFCCGLVFTAAALWSMAGKDPALTEPGDSSSVAAAAPTPRAELRSPAPITPNDLAAPDRARARKLMEAALPVIRARDPQERTARWSLLLTQLLAEGDAGREVLEEFLSTGEDLPLGPRYDLPGIRVPVSTSLRMAILDRLVHVQDPAVKALTIQEAARSLGSARTSEDGIRLTELLEYLAPGRHSEEAIAAARRLAPDGGAKSMAMLTQVMTHHRAPELLPLAESLARKEPEKNLGYLFGSLWRMPAEKREEVTARILAEGALQGPMKNAMAKLDYRLPAAREYAIAWFGSDQPKTAKVAVLEQLGDERGWGLAHRAADWTPDVAIGTPGTLAQAEARLAMLDEISRFCPEPYLQQKIAATRGVLLKQVSK